MAEEKILNDEILKDEQLEAVAGGKAWQLQIDADRLRGIGRLGYGPVNKDDIERELNNLGVGCELHNGKKDNKYYINHIKVSQEEAWNYIYRKIGRY